MYTAIEKPTPQTPRVEMHSLFESIRRCEDLASNVTNFIQVGAHRGLDDGEAPYDRAGVRG